MATWPGRLADRRVGELSVGRMRPLGVLGRNFPRKRLANEVLTGELQVPQNRQGNPPIETGGIKIARRTINNLRYADDTTLWQKVKRN